MDGLIVLIVIAAIVALVFLAPAYFRSLGAVYKDSYNQARRQGLARKAAEGQKPFGAPWEQTYGSAYFMIPEQMIAAGIGMSGETFQQRVAADEQRTFRLLGLSGFNGKFAVNVLERDGHILTIAPTRSGKGVSAVIPNLMTYTGSMVVNDVKGELYAVTSDWRRRLGHRVLRFAPFENDTDFWNPFDFIEEDDEDAWEEARTFAELLLPERTQNEEFWNSEAKNLLSGVILHMVNTLPEEERTMWQLRHLLTQEQEEFDLLLAEMAASNQAMVQRAASTFLRADVKVRDGIMSTLNSHMGIWDSPRLKHMMSKNSYRLPRMLFEPMTVYFSIPPGKLDSYAPVIRLFMGTLIKHFSGYSGKCDYPVQFMLDEFPALGRMKVVEDGITYMAGFGINFWLFAQDLKQLVATYGDKAESIIANCTVKQFFGVSDFETAQLVSHMCGSTTIPHISYSSESGVVFKPASLATGTGERPLVTPNEVMSLPADTQLLFYQGQQVVSAAKINYLTDDLFKDENGQPHYNPNPYHR
ncbi:type IV secretory system conjugative DNA transfer family protein [Croceicoccus sp. Ery15]|uniref:type IV secretory system conjugative DNA transfer family protein n=1 Tax=Croceicoccus sp. Ery15 TaxID=1703338 RepID=UPI001E3BEAED|nr:type IV secretory system conjugative DNA transfer family protein [Croceicoccus sp. Ery15]